MHTRRLLTGIAALLLCAPLAACSAGFGGATSSAPYAPDSMMVEPTSEAADAMSSEAAGRAGSEGSISVVADQERSVIRTGNLTVEVENAREASDELVVIAEGLGGWIESKSVSGSEATRASLTVRVPADRFEEAMTALGEVGKITDENRSSADVTMEHIDLQARIDALEASVERLTALMSGAATTSELIEAESALAARQAELDSLNARLTALEDQIGESTIWVSLYVASPLAAGGPSNFWEGLVAGFQSIGAFASGAVIVLGLLLPWLVVLGIITLAIILPIRASRRRKRARAAQAAPLAQTAPPEAQHPAEGVVEEASPPTEPQQ